MRAVSIPEMRFCHWFAWDDRQSVPLCEDPGIYLLAITEKHLVGLAPDWKDVSYIGMTNSRGGLLQRWQQFFNTIKGRRGHSGGKAVFEDLGHYKTWSKKLFVAAMPIECDVPAPTADDLIKMGWVAYLEYEAFAEFRRHCPSQTKPRYNTR